MTKMARYPRTAIVLECAEERVGRGDWCFASLFLEEYIELRQTRPEPIVDGEPGDMLAQRLWHAIDERGGGT